MSNTFKNARNFQRFDVEAFQKQHVFQLLRVDEGYNYVDGKREQNPSHIKVLLMVVADYTDGHTNGDGVNQWAQFSVKLPAVGYKEHNVSQLQRLIGSKVALVEPEINVYGDYQNMLSIKVKSLGPVRNEQIKGDQ